jgi:hypothetical protein
MKELGCLLATLAALAACGEATIQLELQMPVANIAAEYDPSCVTSVAIYADGEDYPDDDDWNYSCVTLDGAHPTYAQLETELRGSIAIDVPDTGLAGIELYGYTGPCDVENEDVYDLIFSAGAPYTGGDQLALPVLPNLGCGMSNLVVRPINILKLAATRDCAQAVVPTGKMSSSSLSSMILTEELYWWGGLSGGDLAGGVTSFQARAKVGAGLHTLLHSVAGEWATLSAVPPPAQQVCAAAGELEAATIPLAVARASQDPATIAELEAAAFVLVYGAAGPISGAKLSVPASQRELVDIVYLDLPAGVENGTGSLVARAGDATGPSGLAVVYTGAMVDLAITVNGKTVQRKLATATDLDKPPPPVAMIVKLD